MDKFEFQEMLISAHKNNTLMTPKHNPNNLSNSHNTYRSVIAQPIADNLSNFITGGEYNISHYENTNHPDSPNYWVVKPKYPDFSVAASGVSPYSTSATETLDCLVVVSGFQKSFHMFGENLSNIDDMTNSGALIYKGELSDEND